MRTRWIVAAALWLAVAGCSHHADRGAALTERQRDSLIARSPLPGASVVGRAMTVSDAQQVRADRMNAAMDSLTH
jgi:16S rRNA C1402 (ribose-2'-O) methylase RsmI